MIGADAALDTLRFAKYVAIAKLPERRNQGIVMITLTLIVLLIFVPASRSILGGFLKGIGALLGLAFLVSRDSVGRRRGL